jgi:hypothetical protein
MTERSIYDPQGRLQGVAWDLAEKLAAAPRVAPPKPLPPPEGPTMAHFTTAGLILLGLVVLLYLVP